MWTSSKKYVEYIRSYQKKESKMKNVKVKVTESCLGYHWWVSIYEGRKEIMRNAEINDGVSMWLRKFAAIRNAKAIAKQIGVKYDPEIIKQHGC